ncbi:DNA topoisomerase 1 [Skeletonema marinoi]|uniref:DNA topoisomerase 1 n=2 Tax=Skeletonema marinoi TaxID=267567 RepID=A0AAD8Y4M7_9STRA|nr:DNA topoisomerase 1 [Skeletonema marinoi]
MDSSSSDDDVPLARFKKAAAKPDKAVSSAPAAAKKKTAAAKKRPNYKEDSEDDDDDEDYASSPAPPKKKKRSSSASTSTAASTKKKKATATTTKKSTKKTPIKKENGKKKAAPKKEVKGLKQLDKSERISHAMQAYLWWNSDDPPKGQQWCKMEHAGVSFPEGYEPHGVKMRYDGKEVDLTPVEEEAATFFAAMDPDGMHLGNSKTAPIFEKNFFTDFKAILGKNHVIKDFKKCDFAPITAHLNEEKIVRKAITDAERKQNKNVKDTVMFKFGYALVDGHLEKVGNYNMEPPGAFRGRGEHPKMGKLKQRVDPEQVMLNLSECAAVPMCHVPGHAWGDIRHNPTVQWLCSWTENINGQSKYMQLAAQSSFKGKSDRSKYNKAARLCGNIDKIRKDYKKNLTSKSNETRQLATAMWVIDRLALRVGGEKDTEEEADTVGCCSLRVEHLKFDPNDEGGIVRRLSWSFWVRIRCCLSRRLILDQRCIRRIMGWENRCMRISRDFARRRKLRMMCLVI